MKKRLFVALNLDPESVTQAGYLADRLSEITDVRVVPKDQFHLTLAFLGDIDIEHIPTLQGLIEKGFQGITDRSLKIWHPDVFRSWDDLRGIWVESEASAELRAHKTAFRDQIKAAGFELDFKQFTPHITLGRTKSNVDVAALKHLLHEWADFVHEGTAESVSIYSSYPGPQGSVYEDEYTFSLK